MNEATLARTNDRLRLWSELEPDRVRPHKNSWVIKLNGGFFCFSPQACGSLLLAVIEAIERQGWTWKTWRELAFYAAEVKGESSAWDADSPGVALLSAYLHPLQECKELETREAV